ncbi:hypothetical protein [Vibrio chagasii]
MVVRVPLFIAIGEVVRVDASKRDVRYETYKKAELDNLALLSFFCF